VFAFERDYRVVPSHRNSIYLQIETALCNLAGFLLCVLKIRWQRFGHFFSPLMILANSKRTLHTPLKK